MVNNENIVYFQEYKKEDGLFGQGAVCIKVFHVDQLLEILIDALFSKLNLLFFSDASNTSRVIASHLLVRGYGILMRH